jgi:hypothetical protein
LDTVRPQQPGGCAVNDVRLKNALNTCHEGHYLLLYMQPTSCVPHG